MSFIVSEFWVDLKVGILRSLGVLRRWAVGPYGVAILSDTENGLLLAPSGDLMVGRRLSFNGRYDPELLGFILQKSEPGFHVLFVGAHVGALAIPVARKVRKVTAVEANPETFELLRMNVLLNNLQNVEVLGFAAGERNGEVSFLKSQLNSGASRVGMGVKDRRTFVYDKQHEIVVQMKRLDDVFPHDRFDLIVMDIEGGEAAAMRGMTNLLEQSRGLLVEVFESHLRNIAKVSNDEFLAIVTPFFEEAIILPEKPRKGEPIASPPYMKSEFPEMMLECCRRGTANVMFLKETPRTTVKQAKEVVEETP
jgi:FkbM family methyltransferase